MKRPREKKVPLQTQLGLLAMQFRGTRDEEVRAGIVAEYERVVAQLIESGKWKEMPAFEDMLPDDRMPRAFFNYWEIPYPTGQRASRDGRK